MRQPGDLNLHGTGICYSPGGTIGRTGFQLPGGGEVMAQFDCDWCGKCCASFGEFITIERQLTDRDYYCRYGITGEIFPVHVLPGFADDVEEEFAEPSPQATASPHKGCIFMKKDPEGKGFACAIYPSRPTVCREFRCYRMLIYDPSSGEIRGKVIGINELRTHDQNLAAIWKEKIARLPHPLNGNNTPTGHAPVSGAHSTHGHDSHIHAHIHDPGHTEDKEWLSAVIGVLAEHGYHGEPVD